MSQKLHVSHVVLALFFPEPRYPDDHLESLLLPFVVGTTQFVIFILSNLDTHKNTLLSSY
jgi:hypothetical protein